MLYFFKYYFNVDYGIKEDYLENTSSKSGFTTLLQRNKARCTFERYKNSSIRQERNQAVSKRKKTQALNTLSKIVCIILLWILVLISLTSEKHTDTRLRSDAKDEFESFLLNSSSLLRFDHYTVLNHQNKASNNLLVAPVYQYILSNHDNNCQKLVKVGLKNSHECKILPTKSIKKFENMYYEVVLQHTYKPWLNNTFLSSSQNSEIIMSELITFNAKTKVLIKTNTKTFFRNDVYVKKSAESKVISVSYSHKDFLLSELIFIIWLFCYGLYFLSTSLSGTLTKSKALKRGVKLESCVEALVWGFGAVHLATVVINNCLKKQVKVKLILSSYDLRSDEVFKVFDTLVCSDQIERYFLGAWFAFVLLKTLMYVLQAFEKNKMKLARLLTKTKVIFNSISLMLIVVLLVFFMSRFMHTSPMNDIFIFAWPGMLTRNSKTKILKTQFKDCFTTKLVFFFYYFALFFVSKIILKTLWISKRRQTKIRSSKKVTEMMAENFKMSSKLLHLKKATVKKRRKQKARCKATARNTEDLKAAETCKVLLKVLLGGVKSIVRRMPISYVNDSCFVNFLSRIDNSVSGNYPSMKPIRRGLSKDKCNKVIEEIEMGSMGGVIEEMVKLEDHVYTTEAVLAEVLGFIF